MVEVVVGMVVVVAIEAMADVVVVVTIEVVVSSFVTTATPMNFPCMVNDPVDTLAEKLFVLVSKTPTTSAW
jgi:hypothetical protein